MDKTMLEYALSIGFPTWAVVVLMASARVTNLIKELTGSLRQAHTDADKRITLLEETVKRLEHWSESHDERLRELEREK